MYGEILILYFLTNSLFFKQIHFYSFKIYLTNKLLFDKLSYFMNKIKKMK